MYVLTYAVYDEFSFVFSIFSQKLFRFGKTTIIVICDYSSIYRFPFFPDCPNLNDVLLFLIFHRCAYMSIMIFYISKKF